MALNKMSGIDPKLVDKAYVGMKKRMARLKKKETRLVNKGNKAVDEGREKKADRLLSRAAKTENRIIKLSEKKKGGAVPKGYHKMPDGTIMKNSEHKK